MDGKRLKDLREELGLTQKQLAEELHLTYHAISGYERNKSEPSDEIKIKMARYFNVSIDYLLGISDLRNNNFEGENEIITMMKQMSKEDRQTVQKMIEILNHRFQDVYKNN